MTKKKAGKQFNNIRFDDNTPEPKAERIKRTYYVDKDVEKRMKLICIENDDTFPELSTFVNEAIKNLCEQYE